MNSEEQILAALKALAEEDRTCEAPPRVEAKLLAAFRAAHSRRPWHNPALWAAVAAALLIATLVGLLQTPRVPRDQPATTQPIVTQPTQPVATQPGRDRQEVVRSEAAPLPRRAKARPKPAPREIVTEFFPVADAAPPFESGALLRVIVPASTMRTVGLPVREDRGTEPVQADVLIGQEGLVRAIRFVSFEQQ